MIDRLGITVPTLADSASAGLALAILLLVWVVAVFAARKAGPRLAHHWAHVAGARVEGIAQRMCDLVRYATAALILAIAVNADSWRPLGALLLGFGLALSTALLVIQLMRGLHMPRWVGWLLAAAAFVALFADAVGGLDPVMATLDRVGFSAGTRRFSLLTVLQIAITLLVLLAAVRLASRVINQSIKRVRGIDATQQLLAQKIAGIALLLAAFFIGIDIVGIDLTALAVFSGAFGLAVGFGFQKTFGNLIAGIILLMDRSVKPGDVIAVADSFGAVNKIGVRAVSIITREGKEHLIPNELLMTEEVVNWSYSSRNVRVSIPVGISYDSDIALARKLMGEAARKSKRVLDSPDPKVWIRGFGENAVNLEIRLWIEDPEDGVGSVQSEVLESVWDLFKASGIGFPYPQRDVRIKEWPGSPIDS